jgi:hypothetical protein
MEIARALLAAKCVAVDPKQIGGRVLKAAVRTAPELDGNAVAGLAGDLYAASCLVGPLPYAKMPAAILVADDAPDAAGPEALKLRDVARAILAFHDNQLPLFRLGIGLEDPMHGRIIAATPAAARVVFK